MPGTDALHSALTGANIHVPYRFTYANAAAREAEAGAVPGDVGCLALQEDDNTLWMLTDDDPLTWRRVGYDAGADASNVTYTPTTATDWDSDTDPGDLDDALDQLAERVDDLEGAGGGSGDMTWAIVQAMQLCNEVMGYPSMVGIDVDLAAAAQWWDSVGTPTTAVTMVDVAGEAGITETWEYALKCVVDDAAEGFYQRYTYADQPRIKSGRKLSAIAAVWVGTAGTTVTMKLVTSASTEVSATATAQAWTIIKCEGLTLDGTYVDLQFTADTADTFYVVPLGVNIGEKAVPLRPRGFRYIRKAAETVAHDLHGSGAQARSDLDLTAVSGSLAAMANLTACMKLSGTGEFGYHVYPNFWAAGAAQASQRRLWAYDASGRQDIASFEIPLDDQQVIEDELTVWNGSTISELYLYINGYWEWE